MENRIKIAKQQQSVEAKPGLSLALLLAIVRAFQLAESEPVSMIA